ncbi:MAG: hypothetical protein J3Q66DRAFT_297854, partial [Benniella sp.]
MFDAIVSKFQRVWSANDSEITRANCGHAPFSRLVEARRLLTTVLSGSSTARTLAVQSDVLMDYSRDMLHSFPYRDVPPCWRELYTDAGILKALALGLLTVPGIADRSSNDDGTGLLKQALLACDSVLVMSGSSGPGRKAIVYELIDLIETMIEGRQEVVPSAQKRAKAGVSVKLGEEVDQKLLPEIRYPIPRLHLPSLDTFQQHVNSTSSRTPIIISGAIDHWPARERWIDLDTICRTAGPDRLVPIEIGSKYTDEEWTQKLVTMREFIEQYIIGRSCGETGDEQKPVGYLAQHDLFDQIPRLRRDIDIPDYCMVGPREQDGYQPPDDVLLNAWFGPQGTVSPMHTDPYHNLLAQVVGKKYIRLYAPKETAKLYCYGSDEGSQAEEANMLGNTSQVDVEHPDLNQYPLFAEAEYVEAILGPGEILYIPFQWWHYIRSLSTSFSVSFWF